MQTNKSKFITLLRPSLTSLVSCFSLSFVTIVAIGFSYQAGKGSIYNYLFGKGSSAELIQTSRNTFGALKDLILGNAILNKVLYFAFWMLVGLIVYIILYAILKSSGEAAEDIKEAGYANNNPSNLLQNFAIRFTVRLAGIISLIILTIIFIKVLLPFCSLAAQNASTDLLSVTGLLYALAGFTVLFASLHGGVVLMRFTFLKYRLFSQQEVDD